MLNNNAVKNNHNVGFVQLLQLDFDPIFMDSLSEFPHQSLTFSSKI
jgi:hypothetical protein